MMATTNDAMYVALKQLYPTAGDTLGDLLYAHWSEAGLGYRGALQFDYYVAQGATGTTLGDLANDFWAEDYPIIIDATIFDYNDPDEWLELEIFNRFDTVEQQVILI